VTDEKPQRMTTEGWVQQELAKMPPRSAAWKAETLALWGLKSDSPDDLDEAGIEPGTVTGLADHDRADIPA
jgi:hypothetical protein